jgi:hypothetical protein
VDEDHGKLFVVVVLALVEIIWVNVECSGLCEW